MTSASFSTNDRLLLSHLAIIPNVKISQSLAGELWNLPLDNKTTNNYTELLACLKSQNDPMTINVERWVAACSILSRSQTASHPDSIPALRPLGLIDDDVTAKAMESLIDTNQTDKAEKELLSLRVTGRVSAAYTQCGLVWARIAAERGDIPLFRSRLAAVMETQTWLGDDALPPLDICRSLPSKLNDAQQSAALARTACEVVEQTMASWPGKRDFTRELTRVGLWAHNFGASEASSEILKTSIRLAKEGTCEDQIWIADLANKLGQFSLAMEIQSHLLEERCLPGLRIAPLLQSMQQSGDVDSAKKLSADAASYCLEPNLQTFTRAMESQNAANDHTADFRQ